MSAQPGGVTPDGGRLAGRNLASFALVSLIWGSTWLVIKDQISVIPPGWTVTWRFTLAALGLGTLALVRGDGLRLTRKGAGLAVVVGLLQFCLNFQCVYRAEHYVPSGLVAVMYALLMVPNALLARALLGTPLRGRFLAGSAVALGGIALLMLQEYRMQAGAGAGQGAVLIGAAFTVTGLLSASLANVLQTTPTGRQQPVVTLLAWGMVAGALANAALAGWLYGPPVWVPSPRYWAGVGYLAIAGSVITFPVYFSLIRAIGAGKAGYSNVVVPVVAMGLSTLFEGYRWSALAVGGSALALVGLVIALSRPRSVAAA